MQNTISSVAFFKVSLLPAKFILMIGSVPLLRVECISCFSRTLVRHSGYERQISSWLYDKEGGFSRQIVLSFHIAFCSSSSMSDLSLTTETHTCLAQCWESFIDNDRLHSQLHFVDLWSTYLHHKSSFFALEELCTSANSWKTEMAQGPTDRDRATDRPTEQDHIKA